MYEGLAIKAIPRRYTLMSKKNMVYLCSVYRYVLLYNKEQSGL